MASISDLYTLCQPSKGGIEGYSVSKKYYDPGKMIEQRKNSISPSKPMKVSKKTTYIDEELKRTANLPGPFSYETDKSDRKKASSQIIKVADRMTFIDELTKMERKRNVPGAGAYEKNKVETDPKNFKSSLSKAKSVTYVEGCMRNAIETPGVGYYNTSHDLESKGVKWDKYKQKDKKQSKMTKFPSVGAYNPDPVNFSLFSSISGHKKDQMQGGLGGKTQRFKKSSKQKQIPFYNILSQWGIKNKNKKNDILLKISRSPSSNRSVYY